MGRRRATCTVLVTVGLATLLAACSGADDVVQVRATDPAPSSSSVASSAVPSTATTSAPSSTVATGPATGPATGSATATSAPSATATASGTGTATSARPSPGTSTRTTATRTATATATRPATPPAATWPKPLGEPQQGQPAWAVYLAIGHGSTDPVVEKAVRQAAGVHYSAVVGDMACDVGSMEALKLDQFDLWTGATVYFPTQADARAFATSYTRAVAKPKGVVKVKVGCLD